MFEVIKEVEKDFGRKWKQKVNNKEGNEVFLYFFSIGCF